MLVSDILQEGVNEDKLRKRFMSHVVGSNPDSCWIWRHSHKGDGFFYLSKDEIRPICNHGEGKIVSAKRFMYLLTFREIPEGKKLKSVCHVRGCVNPTHLEVRE